MKKTAFDEDEAECERMLTHMGIRAATPFPVDHAAHIQLYTAYSIERFETREAAIEAYRTVMTQAHDVGIHQVAFKAEQSLNALTQKG